MLRHKRRHSSGHGWLILLESDAWQIFGPNPVDPPSEKVTFPPEQIGEQAAAIYDALGSAGWSGQPLVLGVSAGCCLAATVDVPAPAMLRKPQAMRYHLEAWIPWSAEDFVAEFVAHKNAALMVAVRWESFKELLTELDALDAAPAAMVSAALLALERHLMAVELPADHLLLWRHGADVEAFVIRDRRPLVWRHAEGDAAALTQLAAMIALDQTADLPWFARGAFRSELDDLASGGVSAIDLPELGWETALCEATREITAGEVEPIINLRRDELAGERPILALASQLAWLKAAAAMTFIAVCAALWIRGDRYQQSADVAHQRLIEVYEATFPKEPAPDRMLVAIRKSHGLLQGTRGPAKELPAGPSSDAVLEKVLAALPGELRYRVPEIRIEGASVYLTGEIRSNADADRIAAALRQGGFDVEPPRTQRLPDQGFAVRLAARGASGAQKGTTK